MLWKHLLDLDSRAVCVDGAALRIDGLAQEGLLCSRGPLGEDGRHLCCPHSSRRGSCCLVTSRLDCVEGRVCRRGVKRKMRPLPFNSWKPHTASVHGPLAPNIWLRLPQRSLGTEGWVGCWLSTGGSGGGKVRAAGSPRWGLRGDHTPEPAWQLPFYFPRVLTSGN